ncbi:SCO2-like protein RBE_0699 [Methylophilaceae bacterium]|nr:SCO2-like protein RBE_0699 [Methylophilaceae bacterium]
MKKIVLLFLTLICLISCQNSHDQTFVGTDISSVPIDTTFRLKDFNGQIRTLEDFKGKVVVIFFGFTHCPDICPTTLTDLKKTMALLKDKASDVQVIFITLDPARDTEDVLKKFIPTFNSSFSGLLDQRATLIKS